MGDWHGAPHWYGGNIEQRAQLEVTGSLPNLQFSVVLQPPILSYKSRALSRFLGSRRVLQVSLPLPTDHDLMKRNPEAALSCLSKFLSLTLICLGRTWLLFTVKENKTAWFIETVSTLDSSIAIHASDQHRLPYEQVIHWLNSTEYSKNFKQVSQTERSSDIN
jgi:hypothetical protein